MIAVKITLSVLAIAFGAFLFAYGEVDDSPGGQALGAVIVFIGILSLIKIRKKSD